ncbi:MAG: DUF3798 domain-containing protein [Oscillospiraceae bacterium]|jgi:hypothetical protein|nr:DUF3798 domain-containing protein [Oscillospiraceae bacterium]
MKNRVIAAILACVVILAGLTACGRAKRIPVEGKILIFAGSANTAPIETAFARELQNKYAVGAVLVNKASDEVFFDDAKFKEHVKKVVAGVKTLRAVMFAQAPNGTASAARWIKDNYPDVRISVCQPTEEPMLFMDVAKLVVDFDYDALARGAAKQAKELGANRFYYVYTAEQASESRQKIFLAALREQCETEGLELSSYPSTAARAIGIEAAKTYIQQLVLTENSVKPDGTVIAWYATDRVVNNSLTVAVLRAADGVLPGLSDGSPFAMCTPLMGSDWDSEMMRDTEAAIEQIRAAAILNGTNDRISLWQESLPAVAMELALSFQLANNPPWPSARNLPDRLSINKAKAITVKKGNDDDKNYYVISCDIAKIKG